MKNKNTLKNALVIASVVILGAVLIGYFAFNRNGRNPEGPSTEPGTTRQEDSTAVPETTENSGPSTAQPGKTAQPDIIEKDTELTKELEKEKIVELGNIYVRGGVAYGAIVVKESASKEDARKVAQEYMNKMKKRYSGMKINVQVVRDGENLVNLTEGF